MQEPEKASWTPGPWKADIRAYGYEVRPEGQQRECWATVGGTQPLACHTPVLDSDPWSPTPYVPLTPEQAANARLIAAAPLLVEACKAVADAQKAVDTHGTACDFNGCGMIYASVLEELAESVSAALAAVGE